LYALTRWLAQQSRAQNNGQSNWIASSDGERPMMTGRIMVLASLFLEIVVGSSGMSVRGDEPGARSKPPYPPSPIIRNIVWDLGHLVRLAPGSDLWPVTWADDDRLYTSWGDGGGFGGTNNDGRVSLGFGFIEGSPENPRATNVWGGKNALHRATFPGKSNGMLCVGGVLYTHVIEQGSWWRAKIGRSTDHDRTWDFNEGVFRPDAWDFAEPDGAFSDLTFLNFGKDYQGARDEFVYIYSQDKRRDSRGRFHEVTDSVALSRVPKTRIMDRSAQEYFAGLDNVRSPRWTRDISHRTAVFENPGAVGWGVRVAYNPGLRRYLLTTFLAWDGSWGIFDAPEPWGPWTTVATYERWIDATPKFGFTFPQKWTSSDGRTMWMVFSGTQTYDSFNAVKATLRLR
jgi:hypothetical protein